MPGFYPALPKTNDAAKDRELRVRVRQLADDIEASIDALHLHANKFELAHAGYGVAFYQLVERLFLLVEKLRKCADKYYPGPHPEPWRAHVMDLDTSARGPRDVGATALAKALAELCERLDQLNRDWPDFDAMTPRRSRAEVEAGAAGAAVLLKSVEATGGSEDSFI